MYKKKTYKMPPSDENEAKEACYKTAMYILAYRDNTEEMLRQKLRLRHYKADTIDDTVDKLKQNGYLNEKRFAELYANELFSYRRFGKHRIKAELYKRGFSSEIIDGLDLDGYDYLENCKIRLAHLGGEKSDKNIASLRRYGFDFETINKAYEEKD